MGEILFLSHRVPFPPDRGDKIRSHHFLKALAKLATVHVATFGETETDLAQQCELDKIARTYALIPRDKSLPRAGIEAILKRKPVSLTAFDDAGMRRYIAKTLSNHPIDTIFVFSGQMGQYIPADFDGRVVVDLCDLDSLKFDAYAQAGDRAWINRREGRLLSREEDRLARLADTTLLISDNEVALFRSRLSHPETVNVAALGNGVDAEFFDPDLVAAQPDLVRADGLQLVFTGQMDYPPNVAAVEWMIEEIMPRLRAVYPQARFHIVGRAPGPKLKDRHGENGICVWGEVADVRPFMKAADIVVAPLLIARGVQNKVLEAMAMARPVVVTPEAGTGIDAVAGKHFVIATVNPEAFVDAIIDLARDRQRSNTIGADARRFVVDQMSWRSVEQSLSRIVSHSGASRDAA